MRSLYLLAIAASTSPLALDEFADQIGAPTDIEGVPFGFHLDDIDVTVDTVSSVEDLHPLAGPLLAREVSGQTVYWRPLLTDDELDAVWEEDPETADEVALKRLGRMSPDRLLSEIEHPMTC